MIWGKWPAVVNLIVMFFLAGYDITILSRHPIAALVSLCILSLAFIITIRGLARRRAYDKKWGKGGNDHA